MEGEDRLEVFGGSMTESIKDLEAAEVHPGCIAPT
jgi:hypothetical protein